MAKPKPKLPISLRIDADLLEQLREEAEAARVPYQTYLQAVLSRRLTDAEIQKQLKALEKLLNRERA